MYQRGYSAYQLLRTARRRLLTGGRPGRLASSRKRPAYTGAVHIPDLEFEEQ